MIRGIDAIRGEREKTEVRKTALKRNEWQAPL
jgi:hypothetical protein